MHARQGFSLWKIIYWVVGMTIVGLIFVVLWLCLVRKMDLQNAFIPFTFMAMVMTLGLAIPQYLGVD